MSKGKFITFEGSEGTGKTTQIEILKQHLLERQIDTVVTREPGGTPIAEKIRHILLDKDNTDLCTDAEMLLVFAARSQHINELILPAINSGKWVICDRFTDSSFAYQGYGRGLSLERINQLKSWVQGDFDPDLSLLFDLPVDVGLSRANKRGPADRFEQEEITFFEKVRDGFLSLAEQDIQRFKIIDANESISKVSEQMIKIVDSFI